MPTLMEKALAELDKQRCSEEERKKNETECVALYEQALLFEQQNKFADAYKKYQEAKQKGFFKAGTAMGALLLSGKIGQQDKKAAYDLFKEASDKGHGRAKYNLGLMLFKADGVKGDLPAALNIFEEVAKSNDVNIAALAQKKATEIRSQLSKH